MGGRLGGKLTLFRHPKGMTVTTHQVGKPARSLPRSTARIRSGAALSLALMVPMILSGLVFVTYDIAMDNLALEILRQLNTPFVIAELAVIALAGSRGMRLSALYGELPIRHRIAFGIFLALFWVGGVLVSPAWPFASLSNLSYLIHIVFLASVVHLARDWGSGDTAVFGRMLLIVMAAFAALIAIRFASPPAGRPVDTIRWQFAVPGFISVRLFGAIAGAWAILTLALAIMYGREARFRPWILVAAGFAVGMVVWSGTRAAILGVGGAAIIGVVFYRQMLSDARRTLLPVVCAALAGAALAIVLLPYGDPDFLLLAPDDFKSSGSADGITSGRVTLWIAAWQAFTTVPMFGAGPGASSWILPPDIAKHIQPHNLVIEALLSWGTVAAGAALYLLAAVVVAAHRRAARVLAAVPFLLAADGLLIMAFFDGTFHFAQHLMFWAAMTGLALGLPAPERARATAP